MSKTVFVIGAGASYEVGLPIGSTLTGQIKELLNFKFERGAGLIKGSDNIFLAIENHVARDKLDVYTEAARSIARAMDLAASIDNFIDSRREDEAISFCGKLAIVQSILDAERKSKLAVDYSNTFNSIKFGGLAVTWLIPFFQLIQENCTFEELPARLEKITLIIFNYDRCVEHFLRAAIERVYSVSQSEAVAALRSLKIFHPYGKVGALPVVPNNGVRFGFAPEPHHLVEISKGIRTFTQGVEIDGSDVAQIRRSIRYANRMVFLGFAFHAQNMELLSLSEDDHKFPVAKTCIGTAFKRSSSDAALIKKEIELAFRPVTTCEIADLECCDFFSAFSKSLSLVDRA